MVDALAAEINELKVEVPRSPLIVVVAVLPMNNASIAENDVDDADLKTCKPDQLLE